MGHIIFFKEYMHIYIDIFFYSYSTIEELENIEGFDWLEEDEDVILIVYI